ncbi:MAG: hypothetical protein ABFE07_15645 [Armatimonadia bacterium]
MHDHPSRLALEQRMEEEADRLLWADADQPGDLEYSFHSESWLRRTARIDHLMELPVVTVADCPGSVDLLNHVIGQAQLPPKYERVLEFMRRGMGVPELAHALGIPERTARRRRGEVIKLLRARAGRVARDDDSIKQARREQVAGGRYYEEKHCEPGKEACCHSGLCRYRWYLYFEGE